MLELFLFSWLVGLPGFILYYEYKPEEQNFGTNAKFLPVVLESFGASAATGVQDLVNIIAEKAESSGRLSYKQFCLHAAYAISTALHQSNAAVYNHALHQLRSILNHRMLSARR